MAKAHATGASVCGHRPRLELDDLRGYRLVLSDRLRDVRFKKAGFSYSWAGILLANGSKRRGYAGDPLGTGGDDRGDCDHGSTDLAAGDRLGGEIQVRASRRRAGSPLACSRSAEKLPGLATDRPPV